MQAVEMSAKRFEPNELRMDLLASSALNPWPGHDSSSRVQMFNSHLGQHLQIVGCTKRRCITGAERRYGEFTISVKMPCNAEIVRVIPRYSTSVGLGGIKENPVDVVIYQDVEAQQFGIIEVPRHHCNHQHFGIKYKHSNAYNTLMYPGAHVPKDTILADSPSIDVQGNYRYGRECEVLLASVPPVIEDGVVARRGVLKEFISKGIETRTGSWGKNRYPLNLYGDDTTYKPFPDIGDRVREDGLLFALRSYDELLGPIEMTPAALREPDYTFDKLMYAEPGARIIDVQVRHDDKVNNPPTPVGMEVQTARYNNASRQFYQTLEEEYRKLRRDWKDKLVITPAFHRLLVEGESELDDITNNKVIRTYRRNPLDDWRVQITFEYDVVPTIGFKLTGCHGDKGVICDIWEDAAMPRDQWGNVADFIMDGDSTIKRMNLGRLYEQYYNACSREVTRQVRERFGIRPDMLGSVAQLQQALSAGRDQIDETYSWLLDYYQTISPRMAETARLKSIDPFEHVYSVVRDGVYLWIPTDNPVESVDVVRQLRKRFPYLEGPVTYTGYSGVEKTTRSKFIIGSLYIMLLEKTGGDWSGVASAKLQHFGIPAKLTNNDKHSAPGRGSPIRILGEAECRLFAAVVGGDVTAEILDQSNNPTSHKYILNTILKAEYPTAIPKIIDRVEVPRGNSRTLVFIRHIMECSGLKFVRNLNNPDHTQGIGIVA